MRRRKRIQIYREGYEQLEADLTFPIHIDPGSRLPAKILSSDASPRVFLLSRRTALLRLYWDLGPTLLQMMSTPNTQRGWQSAYLNPTGARTLDSLCRENPTRLVRNDMFISAASDTMCVISVC